jgi:alpha-amylase
MLRRSVATALLALSASLALAVGTAAAPPAATPSAAAAAAYTGPRAGMVQMFDWPWPDIARECTNYLGPKGYWAVQTSPPTSTRGCPVTRGGSGTSR